MQILSSTEALTTWRKNQRVKNKALAFVPTMGNLHEGHLSLIQIARMHAPTTLVSLFVNPTQFGPNEDFDNYPRTPLADIEKLKTARVDAVFAPETPKALYPLAHKDQVLLKAPELANKLCGAYRPNHFDGVLQVVNKLFNLCQPDFAIFGEKDYQQLTLIQRMVTDFFLPVQIVSSPTVRAPSGLALSSRNQYLDNEQKKRAAALYQRLDVSRRLIKQGALDQPKERSAHCQAQMEKLNALGFQMQYYEILDALLNPIEKLDQGLLDSGIVLLAAGHFCGIRLIDNIIVQQSKQPLLNKH